MPGERRLATSPGSCILKIETSAVLDAPKAAAPAAVSAHLPYRPDIDVPRAAWDLEITDHEPVRLQFEREFPQIAWFRASSALCDDKECRAMIDDRLMYRDSNHLSYDGDLRVGSAFARTIGP